MRSEVIKLNYYWGLGCNEMVCFFVEMSRVGEKQRDVDLSRKRSGFHHRYLREAALAVSDVSPIFAVQAVSQFVLPDKRSVLSAGAALQPSCTLGNDATHHLCYTQVNLQRSGT